MRTRVVVAPPAYARAPRRRLVRPKRRSFVTTAFAVVGRVLVTMPRRYGDAGAPVSVRSTRGAGTILVTADQFRLGPGGGRAAFLQSKLRQPAQLTHDPR